MTYIGDTGGGIVKVESINKHLPERFADRSIVAAYPREGFFVIEYAATTENPLTLVYFNQDGREVMAVEES